MKYILIATALFFMLGCTDKPGAEKALLDAGYTHVETGGYSWFKCDEKDTWATKFTATGPTGRKVSGVVCAGWLKGNTIRLD